MLHWDDAEGLLFHRRGRKRVLLWPPEQLGALGHMNHSRFCNAVPVDPFDLDDACARYGDFLCRARPVEAILNPNDLLYIPWGWPHYVLQETQARQPSTEIFFCDRFSHFPCVSCLRRTRSRLTSARRLVPCGGRTRTRGSC